MELSSVTNMPPQRLMLIVGGGVAAGLLWRRFSGKSASSGNSLLADAADGSLSYPGDLNSYPMDTSGNRRDVVSDGLFPTLRTTFDLEGDEYTTDDGKVVGVTGPHAGQTYDAVSQTNINNDYNKAATGGYLAGTRGVGEDGSQFYWAIWPDSSYGPGQVGRLKIKPEDWPAWKKYLAEKKGVTAFAAGS